MVSYSLLPTDGLSVITDFYQPMCDANLVLWYSELGDGVLVDLALLLHELLQLYTKRHRVLNGRACIKLGSTLPVAEVGWRNPFSLLHVVEHLGFGRTLHILHM